jgi:Fe2+ transport system protein FeoA
MASLWQETRSAILPMGLESNRMKTEFARASESLEFPCANPVCPLNQVRAGVAVRVRQLCAAPALADRLREIGLGEDRIVKLLTSHNNIICLVCNTRMALSESLARTILVEPLSAAS